MGNDDQLKVQKYRIEKIPASELACAARKICISAHEVRSDNSFYRELLTHWSNMYYDDYFHEHVDGTLSNHSTFPYVRGVE